MQLRHVTLVLLITFANVAYAQEETIASKLAACNQAIGEGDASKALAYAEQVLKADKNNRGALLCKGRAHGGIAGQSKDAIAALEAADKLSATPIEHMVAITLMGNVYKSNQQYTEALAAYRKSLALAQDEKDVHFQRVDNNLIGETLIDNKQLEAGLESYLAGSKFSANGNDRSDSYERIAAAYSALGKHDQAIEYQVKGVMQENESGDLDHKANAGLEMGRIYTAAGDHQNAEKAINKIIKLSKDNGGAYWEAKSYYYLAQAKLANKQPAEAKTLLTDAQSICKEIGAEALADEITHALDNLPK